MNDVRQQHRALLLGMLSPTWQKPSESKIKRAIADLLEDAPAAEPQHAQPWQPNRQRLTALVAAGTKLDAATLLVREATNDIGRSGLLMPEQLQRIADELSHYLVRITAAIELIP